MTTPHDVAQMTPEEQRRLEPQIGEYSGLLWLRNQRIINRAIRAAIDEQECYGAEDWRNDSPDEAALPPERLL